PAPRLLSRRRLPLRALHSFPTRRSSDLGQPVAQPRTAGGRPRRAYVRDYLRWLRPHWYELGVVFVLALAVAGLQMVEPLFMRFIDRKSTRLNSSHLGISYAVFCLKKKNK